MTATTPRRRSPPIGPNPCFCPKKTLERGQSRCGGDQLWLRPKLSGLQVSGWRPCRIIPPSCAASFTALTGPSSPLAPKLEGEDLYSTLIWLGLCSTRANYGSSSRKGTPFSRRVQEADPTRAEVMSYWLSTRDSTWKRNNSRVDRRGGQDRPRPWRYYGSPLSKAQLLVGEGTGDPGLGEISLISRHDTAGRSGRGGRLRPTTTSTDRRGGRT